MARIDKLSNKGYSVFGPQHRRRLSGQVDGVLQLRGRRNPLPPRFSRVERDDRGGEATSACGAPRGQLSAGSTSVRSKGQSQAPKAVISIEPPFGICKTPAAAIGREVADADKQFPASMDPQRQGGRDAARPVGIRRDEGSGHGMAAAASGGRNLRKTIPRAPSTSVLPRSGPGHSPKWGHQRDPCPYV